MKEISRIELFCDDASVGRIQRMLTQVKGVYDVKAMPVVNVTVKANGHVKAISGGNLFQQFVEHLMKSNITEVKPRDVQEWLVRQGRSKLSANYVLKNARLAGFLIGNGKTSKASYTVQRPKALPAPKKAVKHG